MTIIARAVLASIGTAGVPGAGAIMLMMDSLMLTQEMITVFAVLGY